MPSGHVATYLQANRKWQSLAINMQENEGTPEFFEDISTIILVLEVKSPTTGGKSYLLLEEVGVLGAATNKSAAYEFF